MPPSRVAVEWENINTSGVMTSTPKVLSIGKEKPAVGRWLLLLGFAGGLTQAFGGLLGLPDLGGDGGMAQGLLSDRGLEDLDLIFGREYRQILEDLVSDGIERWKRAHLAAACIKPFERHISLQSKLLNNFWPRFCSAVRASSFPLGNRRLEGGGASDVFQNVRLQHAQWRLVRRPGDRQALPEFAGFP